MKRADKPQALFECLAEHGFFPVPTPDRTIEIFSSEGEAICRMKDGVEYVLRLATWRRARKVLTIKPLDGGPARMPRAREASTASCLSAPLQPGYGPCAASWRLRRPKTWQLTNNPPPEKAEEENRPTAKAADVKRHRQERCWPQRRRREGA